ncbi:MAG: hypothetical protein F4X83_11395 [Chloroflexi bacterium]|nr:hypothetical protein [Chloroflexota bacterium]
MKRLALPIALAMCMLLTTPVSATECQFVLGFKTLRDLIGHEIVGECLENEHHGANGDALQQTTGGLLVWRKADNWTAFTDGYRTWINGPNGLVQRLNTERFSWEADYAPGGGIAAPKSATTPATMATPAPRPVTNPATAPTPDPEAQSRAEQAIAALPWVQNGLGDGLEKLAFNLLSKWAVQSPAVFRQLTQIPWMRSNQISLHQVNAHRLLRHIDSMVQRDEATALRLIQMPFMQRIEYGADGAWRTLLDIFDSDREGFYRLLSSPEIADGIRTDQFPEIPLIYLRPLDPRAAAAIGEMACIHRVPWGSDDLRRLAQLSPPVFWAWICVLYTYTSPRDVEEWGFGGVVC